MSPLTTRRDERAERRARLLRHLRVLPGIALIVAGLGCGLVPEPLTPAPPPRESREIPGTPEWYAINAPLIRAYVETLHDGVKGEPLAGILLSDGTRRFEGYDFLGRPDGLPPGVHVVLFRVGDPPADQGEHVAYLWLDEGAEPFPLPECTRRQTGIRARGLDGSVHAWLALQAEHGVVYTECPPDEWSVDASRSM